MKPLQIILLALSAILFSSCQSNTTMPTAMEMDKYYKEAERRANVQIASLAADRDRGKLSPEEYDFKAKHIKELIPKRAAEMAWTRHELAESEMRALGVPTGDKPVYFAAPSLGGVNGSLYHAPGDPSGNDINQRIFIPPSSGFGLGGAPSVPEPVPAPAPAPAPEPSS